MAARRVGTVLKILAAVGALAVIAAGFLVYQFTTTAMASSRARTESVALLESIRAQSNDADGALRSLPTFDASADLAKEKQSADQYASLLGGDRTIVQAGEVKLRADRDRLANQASSMLALPFRPGLDHERTRAEAMLSALQAADTGLGIEVDQMKAVSAIFDAEASFDTLLNDHLDKKDIPGAIALFPTLDSKLKTAAQLAGGPNTPPQAQKLVGNLQTLSTDLDAFLVAAQRRDAATVLALEPKVDADATALENFDTQGLDAYEKTLLQPYEDRYDAGVRAAGFTPVSEPTTTA
jgi:hypothetical protein